MGRVVVRLIVYTMYGHGAYILQNKPERLTTVSVTALPPEATSRSADKPASRPPRHGALRRPALPSPPRRYGRAHNCSRPYWPCEKMASHAIIGATSPA